MMNIQRALSFIAFGFLFTLLNININSINFTPAFIGWILLFLAYDNLGTYTEGKVWLKWTSCALAVLSLAVWLLGITNPDFDARIVNSLISAVSAVYMYFLLGILEKVADDYGSAVSSKLHTVKVVNLVCVCVFELISVQLNAMKNPDTLIAVITVLLLFFILGIAIYTMFLLFRLRKDIKQLA